MMDAIVQLFSAKTAVDEATLEVQSLSNKLLQARAALQRAQEAQERAWKAFEAEQMKPV